MSFKLKPVAWMTGILGFLSAVVALDETLEATGTADLIPATVEPYAQGAIVFLTILLGKMTYNRVTPLADPRAANGRQLVPTPPAKIPPGVGPSALDATRE
jgi:hypothetical protein